MKTIKLLSIATSTLLFFTACDEGEDANAPSLTTKEAAGLVAEELAIDTEGITLQTTDVFNLYAEETVGAGNGRFLNNCGVTTSKSFERATDDSRRIQADFSLVYDYSIMCNDNVPNQLMANFTKSGNVDAPRYSSSRNGQGSLSVNGLGHANPEYTVNGNYQGEGARRSKVGEQRSIERTVNLALTNVTVNKEEKEITGGTADLTVEGQTSRGSFSYTGTITFLGNQQAEMFIEGQRFVADIRLGEINE